VENRLAARAVPRRGGDNAMVHRIRRLWAIAVMAAVVVLAVACNNGGGSSGY